MKILITGANGFLGSWLCKAALDEPENEIVAAVRKGADLSKLPSSPKLSTREIDYSSESTISAFLQAIIDEFGSTELLIHNAGLTKSTKRADNFLVNEGLTRLLIESIQKTNFLSAGKFAYISSQAALGPKNAGGPVSAYGESKLAAEHALIESGLDHNIFRPTGIYGPGDSEFLKLFKSVKMGVYPCAAPVRQKLTLIHAYDVARNVLAISKTQSRKIIHLSDGGVYQHQEVKSTMQSALKKKALFLRLPMWFIKSYLFVSDKLGALFGFSPILTLEKHGEISKDWDHDFSFERKEIPLSIKFDLMAGFADTVSYYKTKNLL